MQWRLVYKDDVKELRMKLGSHVATITLLLMTQTISSITRAEYDRANVACELRDNILAHRRLLGDVKTEVDSVLSQQMETKLRLQEVKTGIESSLAQQRGVKRQLENQADTIDSLNRQTDQAFKQLHNQGALFQDLDLKVSTSNEGIHSILATATQTLSQTLAGLFTLRDIGTKLYDLIVSIGKFKVEMRESISLLLRLFGDIYQSLRRLEACIARRLGPPIIEFTDALGMTFGLPYQACIQWESFRLMLSALFVGRQGRSRVDKGQFLIIHSVGGRLLLESSWTHAIQEGDHLQMSMTLHDLLAQDEFCPFPSCKASLQNTEMSNGGRTCPSCHRSILSMELESPSFPSPIFAEPVRPTSRRLSEDDLSGEERLSSYESPANLLEEDGEAEDIELYRNINVGPSIRTSDMVSRP